MAFCESCGRSLHDGARFCGGCGALVPDDRVEGDAAATVAQVPSFWACASCGTANDAGASYCSRCGRARDFNAPAAVDQPTVPFPAAAIERRPAVAVHGASTGGGRVSRRTLIIALVVALVLVLGAVMAFVVIMREKSSDTFDSQTIAIVTLVPPSASQVAALLPALLSECIWSTSLAPAVRSAENLRTAVQQAQTASAVLEPQTQAQTATKQALDAALKSLGAYAAAVSGLPPQLSAVTPAQAQALRRDASAAKGACATLSTTAATLPKLAVNDCSVVPAGAHKARKDAALRVFLIKVQNDILNQSQYGRRDIITAVAGVNGMSMNPDDAANMIESVQSNRQSLLDQLSSMTVPDDQRATAAYDLLQQALQHSIEADRYYAAWMHKVFEYYYEEPQGYMGDVPHESNYDEALSQSAMAGTAKSSFCSLYNPLAGEFAMKHNWSQEQI